MAQRIEQDVVVVGGGAAGLSAALSLVRARRRVLVLDGGRPRNGVAPHSHGVLGMDGIAPHDLLAAGRREVEGYGGRVERADVRRLRPAQDHVAVEHGSAMVRARCVVVATGARDELPAIPGLAERWGTGVVVCPYCDGWERRHAVVGVVATSPASVQQAAMLRQWSDRVVYFENGVGGPSADDRRRLVARDVRVVAGPVAAIEGEGTAVAAVRLVDGSVHEVGAVFTGPRLVPRDALLRDLGAVAAVRHGVEVVAADEDGRIGVPRVLAAGNVVDPRANVPVSLGWGALVAGTVNADLIAEDERLATGA